MNPDQINPSRLPTQELAQAPAQAQAPAPTLAPPVEQQLPPPGDYRLSDGLRDLRFDTGDAEFAETYAARFRTRLNRRRTVARKAGTGFLQCRTFENPLEVLKKDFGARLR